MLTFGSLFTGFGGMDLGLELAGLRCVWQCENNPYAQRILARHWPDLPLCVDVRLLDHDGEFVIPDIIVGGDPCQRNSGAGPGNGESLAGEFLRVVDSFRPVGVLRENPTHTRTDAPWPWWRFRAGLESLGYAVLPFRVRACCVGALSERDRLFVFGVDSNAHRDRLEGRKGHPAKGRNPQPPRLLQAEDWPNLLASGTARSRSGISNYVERCRGLGNAVHVAQGYQVGRWLIDSV